MKMLIVSLVILSSIVGSIAAQSPAIGPLVSIKIENEKADADSATESEATVGAMVALYLEKGFELAPEASVTFYSADDPAGIAAWGDGIDRIDFSLGASALWTMANSGIFSFKTGAHGVLTFIGEESPSPYDSYFHPQISIRLPLVIDLALGKSFIVRIEQPVARLEWNGEYFKQTVLMVTTEYADSSFILQSFYDELAPRFSFLMKL